MNTASFRSDRAAARGQRTAAGGAGLSAPGDRGRHLLALWRQGLVLARVQPQGRRQGLDRHDLAEEIRRARALAPRTLCRDRGDAGARAPTRAHSTADRQSGPVILRYGQEEVRQKILPHIAAGELCFCIGLSEPNSGSDVFAASTRATKTDGGWLVNGRKIWTSNAHMPTT